MVKRGKRRYLVHMMSRFPIQAKLNRLSYLLSLFGGLPIRFVLYIC